MRDAFPGPDGDAPLTRSSGVVVIGVGDALRGDDGAGLAVIRELRTDCAAPVEVCAGGAELLDLWHGARAAVLVDAVRSGAAPGTIHRLDASSQALPRSVAPAGTHLIGVGDAIELARALRRLPARVVLYGIEAQTFALGADMSAPVSAALSPVAQRVRDEVARLG